MRDIITAEENKKYFSVMVRLGDAGAFPRVDFPTLPKARAYITRIKRDLQTVYGDELKTQITEVTITTRTAMDRQTVIERITTERAILSAADRARIAQAEDECL